MRFESAQRLQALPPYLFVDIDRKRQEALAAGHDVIDFGVGDPDQPTPEFIINKLAKAITDPHNHRYPPEEGSAGFRSAAAAWFQRRFKVKLDPDTEVLALIGSKEGLGHLPLACVNPGDIVLVPSPGYPVYSSSATFAGAQLWEMPLTDSNHWLPILEDLPVDTVRQARLMFLNYPNNPTGAVAHGDFFKRAVEFAHQHHILIAQDAAYCELSFSSPPPSILETPGAIEVAVEFHSLSKTYNMTGWRIGFAVGNQKALRALARIKSNLDSGQFSAIQEAAIEALNHPDRVEVRAITDVYRQRRDLLVKGLNDIGFEVTKPQATFYVWLRIPQQYDSLSFASKLLEEAQVVVIPGSGFGQAGEGYVRFALTVDCNRTAEALQRLKNLKF